MAQHSLLFILQDLPDGALRMSCLHPLLNSSSRVCDRVSHTTICSAVHQASHRSSGPGAIRMSRLQVVDAGT